MSSKHFCLKWNNFQSNILSAFESLQNTEELTDVTLACEGFNIKAHRFILSACSPYFRNVFKENPCSHPIVILKDVLYVDLIAIINFMYHGEVLVSESQLPSFLETAKLLQVSGLNNSPSDSPPSPPKRPLPPIILPKKLKSGHQPVTGEIQSPKKAKIIKPKKIDKVDKGEICEEEFIADVNENVEVIIEGKSDQQSSILEAALEVRDGVKPAPGSILERSLTSQPIIANISSSSVFQPEVQILPEKPLISNKKPDDDEDDGPPQIVKIEDDDYDIGEAEVVIQDDPNLQQKNLDMQPHHSSQCGNCPHCGKTYSNQSALKYHVRLVHSDLTNMYCCHLCPEAFDYREGYKKHMIDVHFIRN